MLLDAPSEVMKVYPLPKLKVFVDVITAVVEGRNKELSGIAEKVLKSIVKERGREIAVVDVPVIRQMDLETKNVKILQIQHIDEAVDVPVVMLRLVPHCQTVLKMGEAPLAQFIGKVDMPVDRQRRSSPRSAFRSVLSERDRRGGEER